MTSKKAKLIGGPLDGELVDFSGQCHCRNISPRALAPPSEWLTAIYEWEEAADGNMLGIFVGTKPRYRSTGPNQ